VVIRFPGRALVLAGGLALAGCDLGSVTVPRTVRRVVVHGVLSPQLRIQRVMVTDAFDGSYDAGTFGDVVVPRAIYDARVAIIIPEGDTLDAHFVAGSGIYSVNLDEYSTPARRISIVPGKAYDLLVVSGTDTVRGHTVVPIVSRTASVPVTFNRDRDSLSYDFSNAQLARGFWIRAESAIEPYQLMTSNTHARIAGTVRNLETDDLSHAFYPGFLQPITAVATDSNVYNYYRSGSDPFSGVGQINTVTGGIGLFGSINETDRRTVDVTADPTGDPVEGRFTLRSANASIVEMTLYVDSPAGTVVPARITGRYVLAGGTSAGVWATRDPGGTIEFNFLNGYNAQDGRARFLATQRGDSIISQSQPYVVYVRAGK
jgi:hypothetical protein